jgi:hypothetical protein
MPSNLGSKPSVDDIHRLVEDVMDAGAHKYKFVQAEWFLGTSMVQARARLRRGERDGAPVDAINMIDMELAAAEIFGDVANVAFPINREGLLAIGAKTTRNLPRTLRYEAAARARGNTGETAARGWQQGHRREFIDLMTRELYRMIYFPDEDAVPSE